MNDEIKNSALFEDLGKILDPKNADYIADGFDEDGYELSCCGDKLDPDNMICLTCKEHC